MKGEPEVLENLQRALTMELTAVHQYLLHAHIAADWGLGKLADKLREEMHEELGHADVLAERIVFLDGEPDMQSVDSVARAQTIKDMFECDLKDEYEARAYYTKAASVAQNAGDLVTRDLFTKLVHDEEGHIDWIETQLGLIDRLGESTYLQMQVNVDQEDEE